MTELLQFYFEPMSDEESECRIFVLADYPEPTAERNRITSEISDAISSYLDAEAAITYEKSVREVLNSCGLSYEIIDPVTFCI